MDQLACPARDCRARPGSGAKAVAPSPGSPDAGRRAVLSAFLGAPGRPLRPHPPDGRGDGAGGAVWEGGAWRQPRPSKVEKPLQEWSSRRVHTCSAVGQRRRAEADALSVPRDPGFSEGGADESGCCSGSDMQPGGRSRLRASAGPLLLLCLGWLCLSPGAASPCLEECRCYLSALLCQEPRGIHSLAQLRSLENFTEM